MPAAVLPLLIAGGLGLYALLQRTRATSEPRLPPIGGDPNSRGPKKKKRGQKKAAAKPAQQKAAAKPAQQKAAAKPAQHPVDQQTKAAIEAAKHAQKQALNAQAKKPVQEQKKQQTSKPVQQQTQAQGPKPPPGFDRATAARTAQKVAQHLSDKGRDHYDRRKISPALPTGGVLAAWQRAAGITPDGVYGRGSYAALKAYGVKNPPKPFFAQGVESYPWSLSS
jgi:hypothetical protein